MQNDTAISEATRLFVSQHANDDVRQLALSASRRTDIDLPWALQQIQGRQAARRKLPSWAAVDGLLYPVHLSMEQCSSEATARYKAELARRLMDEAGVAAPRHLADLTGGFGVDFAWMSTVFHSATYVERDERLFAVARFNLQRLGRGTEWVNDDGARHLQQMPHATMIYMDPARRDDHGGRTYGIADCTPDVLSLRDQLLRQADFVVLKLSPMLDWQKAVADLGQQWVTQVHVVSVDNECKELLIVLSAQPRGQGIRLVCWNSGTSFEVQRQPSTAADPAPRAQKTGGHIDRQELFQGADGPLFVYEPNASVMKAGCFAELARQFGVTAVAPNSHLFLSHSRLDEFPGRRFQLLAASSMNKRQLRTVLAGLRQANVAVRNFPLSVAQLRQRLKLSEGGSHYLFATTLANGEHVLLVCQRC